MCWRCVLVGSILFVEAAPAADEGADADAVAGVDFDRSAVYDEVRSVIEKHFHDPDSLGLNWKEAADRFRPLAAAARNRDEFSRSVNQLLSTLKASHTFYYSTDDPRRYQLLSIFHSMYDEDREDLFTYEGIGISTQVVDGNVYVSSVYDGLPASIAGLKYGDQILEVGGRPFHAMESFRGRADSGVDVLVVRGGEEISVRVPVARLDGRTMFETALGSSVRVVERNDRRIGYLHAWSYAGQQYQDTIRSELLWGRLSKCDAVILDLRDGWGGADLNYLNLFRRPIATVGARMRDGTRQNYSGVWGRPVLLLTNGRSTSGKELFTYGFRKLRLGKVVGERTAGAVLGGRAFLMSNGAVLYVAVTSVDVDGEVLEGKGVAPDEEVRRNLPDGASDGQLQRALEMLSEDDSL